MENYLGYPIIACFKDWMIVDDLDYNLMVFPFNIPDVLRRYNKGWMPVNSGPAAYSRYTHHFRRKCVEYYDRKNFDGAVLDMILNALHNGFRC